MPVDPNEFWTPERVRAVYLLFEGQLSKTKIAQECGVTITTLDNWIHDAEFQARLADLRNRLTESLEGTAFVKKEQRIIALSKLASDARDEWENRRYLTEERPAPGGTIINERLNEGAAKLFLSALNDIARELGERQTNVRLSGKVETQQTVVINMVDMPDAARHRYLSTKIIPDEADLIEAQSVQLLDSPSPDGDDSDDTNEE